MLDAAALVFARQGYHRALVSEIVSQAEAGQGTFYRYFRDKREIFDALFDRFVESVFAEFSEMTANLPRDVGEYRAASVAAIRRIAARAEGNRDLLMLLVREGPTVDEAFARKLTGFYEGLAALARGYLEHAIAAGFARRCNAEAVSQALVGMAFWMAQQWWQGRLPGVTLERLIEEMVDFAFLGFGGPVVVGGGGADR
ncbi:MAG: TetR/AcrR family transcriptional regulator [Deltaproteobacteria bacterium]|nr:TetR/AcrR family transcriptional regulator [Deltaproteobacteria bacterium]